MNDALSALKYLYHEFMDDKEQDVTRAMLSIINCEVTECGINGRDSFYIEFHNNRTGVSYKLHISDLEKASVKFEKLEQ